MASRRLTWFPQFGVGYYPVECGTAPYDQDYFDSFERNAATDLGRAIMAARCEFVEEHYRGELVDIGIGSGAFIEARQARGRETLGYDVNPAGIDWLVQRDLYANPYCATSRAVSLWDVLEHMPDFDKLLERVERWVFLSLPIFRDAEHALCSKHFKPREHCWYFTRDGLVAVMAWCGFDLLSENVMETRLGREDIGTFSFRRVND
jgi:hypothetical protein